MDTSLIVMATFEFFVTFYLKIRDELQGKYRLCFDAAVGAILVVIPYRKHFYVYFNTTPTNRKCFTSIALLVFLKNQSKHKWILTLIKFKICPLAPKIKLPWLLLL